MPFSSAGRKKPTKKAIPDGDDDNGSARNFAQLLDSRSCRRKQIRKERKRLKATCRVAFSAHKKISSVLEAKSVETKDTEKRKRKREKRRRQREKKRSENPQKRGLKQPFNSQGEEEELEGFDDDYTLERFKQEAEAARTERMREWLDDDDREIARLEAKLSKTKKRKKKEEQKDGENESEEETESAAVEEDEDELERALFGSDDGESGDENDAEGTQKKGENEDDEFDSEEEAEGEESSDEN